MSLRVENIHAAETEHEENIKLLSHRHVELEEFRDWESQDDDVKSDCNTSSRVSKKVDVDTF